MAKAKLALALLLAGCTSPAGGPALAPSQEAKGFDLTRSLKGEVEWKLQSPRAIFQEKDSSAKLDSPKIVLYKKGRPQTEARADTGVIDLGTYDTVLSGVVNVSNRAERIQLKTDLLEYVAKAKEFRTERPVEIRRPEGVMRGRGLTANQDLTEIHVRNQVTRIE